MPLIPLPNFPMPVPIPLPIVDLTKAISTTAINISTEKIIYTKEEEEPIITTIAVNITQTEEKIKSCIRYIDRTYVGVNEEIISMIAEETQTLIPVVANPPPQEEILYIDRCPKCFSKLGTWQDDSILTKSGINKKLNIYTNQFENTLQTYYKGFLRIKAIHIKELQDIRIQQEIDSGIIEVDRTEFSKVQSDEYGYWIINKKHIAELRESTEKILEITGQTKEDYFNYDEEGIERKILHQMDWIDLGLTAENGKYQIKDMHIEDLRKFLMMITSWCQSIFWIDQSQKDILIDKQGIIDFNTPIIQGQIGQSTEHFWTTSIIGSIIPSKWTSYSNVKRLHGTLIGTSHIETDDIGTYYEEMQIYTKGYPTTLITPLLKINTKSQLRLFAVTSENAFHVDSNLFLGDTFHCIDTIYSSLDDPSIEVRIRYDTPLGYIDGGGFIRFSVISAWSQPFDYNSMSKINLLRNCYDDLMIAFPDAIKYYNGELGSKGFVLSGINLRSYCSLTVFEHIFSYMESDLESVIVNFTND